MNVDAIYYINLEKRPNRKEHFLHQCAIHNIPEDKIVRFNAIDGLTHDFSEEEKKLVNFVPSGPNERVKYREKIHGNQLSHYYVFKDMIEKQYNRIIIVQDDVIFCPNFIEKIHNVLANLPDDAEMVNFGTHQYANCQYFVAWDFSKPIEIEPVNDHIGKFTEIKYNPCSLSYILTLQGAKNLTECIQTHGYTNATDGFFNKYLLDKHIFYFPLQVLATGNASLPSDIFLADESERKNRRRR